MSTNTHYRLYIAKENALVPSMENVGKKPQNDFYLTNLENTVLHNTHREFFDPKTRKKITRELKPGETVSVLRIIRPEYEPERFKVGIVYRIPAIAYSIMRNAAGASQGDYSSAHARVNRKYTDRIRAAQEKADWKTEKKLISALQADLAMLPQPLEFERLVKLLAVQLIMADRKKKLEKKK